MSSDPRPAMNPLLHQRLNRQDQSNQASNVSTHQPAEAVSASIPLLPTQPTFADVRDSETSRSQSELQLKSANTTSTTALAPSRIWKKQRLLVAWKSELLAVFFSLGSAIAIAVVLKAYDKKPLIDWNFPASLNTVVSTLGVISRATMAYALSACLGQHKWTWFQSRRDTLVAFDRFDGASRGPWGSLKLLYQLRAL